MIHLESSEWDHFFITKYWGGLRTKINEWIEFNRNELEANVQNPDKMLKISGRLEMLRKFLDLREILIAEGDEEHDGDESSRESGPDEEGDVGSSRGGGGTRVGTDTF